MTVNVIYSSALENGKKYVDKMVPIAKLSSLKRLVRELYNYDMISL